LTKSSLFQTTSLPTGLTSIRSQQGVTKGPNQFASSQSLHRPPTGSGRVYSSQIPMAMSSGSKAVSFGVANASSLSMKNSGFMGTQTKTLPESKPDFKKDTETKAMASAHINQGVG